MSDETTVTEDSSAAPASQSPASANRQRASQLAQALRSELQKAVIGQSAVIDDLLTALIAGGHVLVEGVPTRSTAPRPRPRRPCWKSCRSVR